MNTTDLAKIGISVPKNIETTDVKKVIKKIASTNNAIVDLIDQDEKDFERMKEINQEIKEKCKRLLAELKDIRADKKARQEKKLLLLGERIAYFKEMKQLGLNVKQEDLAQITTNASSRKMLVGQEN
ncbi:MAG: hypothetical protein DYG97_10185 [Ignavibacteria bacterium CHB3]|nr:hypothetical protein [Ignavibacteria bacterium CHB3]